MTAPAHLLFPPSHGTQVHGSTLLVRDHEVLVAWFSGPHEGATESTIHVLRRAQGLSTITALEQHDELPHWNPVLAEGPDGRVWLFFKRGVSIDEWTTWVCRSGDGGRTWSLATELVEGDRSGGRGPVRQQPLTHRGLWLAPGSVEVWSPLAWDSFIDISDDGGLTWEQTSLPLDHASIQGAGCIQPCLVRLPHGELVTLARSTAGRVFRSATDDPRSWPPLEPTALPNSNSGLAASVLPDGRIIVAHNDASDNWGGRARLLLSASTDGGHSWATVRKVEDGGRAGAEGRPIATARTGVVTTGDGEFSYPSMSIVDDEVWITYSWQRRSIALVRWAWNGSETDAPGLLSGWPSSG